MRELIPMSYAKFMWGLSQQAVSLKNENREKHPARRYSKFQHQPITTSKAHKRTFVVIANRKLICWDLVLEGVCYNNVSMIQFTHQATTFVITINPIRRPNL